MPATPLKALVVTHYHPELVCGGAQQVGYELFQGLRRREGVACTLLAAATRADATLFDPEVRITGFNGRPDEYLFLTRDYDHWWQKASDPALTEAYVAFLRACEPDVVHFHQFLNIGIDVVTLTRRVLPSVRIIFTLHEFLAICQADGHMLRRTDGSLCRDASSIRCHQCFPDRHPDEIALRKTWFMQHLRCVDHFTCPSRFMIDHYAAWGLPLSRLSHVPNGQGAFATPMASTRRDGPMNRFGYFGQFHQDKGIHVLLRAVEHLRGNGFTDFRVEINAANLRFASPDMQALVKQYLATEQARPVSEQIVVDNGPYERDHLQHRMVQIDWTVVPSIWWESFGLVISEAWAFGKPVICSNVGGMAERVRNDIDGLHFPVGSARALADTIWRACTEDGLWHRLHDALPVPHSLQAMVDDFLALYRSV